MYIFNEGLGLKKAPSPIPPWCRDLPTKTRMNAFRLGFRNDLDLDRLAISCEEQGQGCAEARVKLSRPLPLKVKVMQRVYHSTF
ncbi:hypothetical protein RRG08_041852 [Elysia crispata]|uniref:Uncharacterized protein n=1 Tax=Elysia crispata TaxID=231223 RepID=A0AAE1CR01_9GAST|nr:hypothetical protein RRG08_041852 [Elysia crispata]